MTASDIFNFFFVPKRFKLERMEPLELPIDGILDLHTFQPREVKTLIPDYLAACRKNGILEVRLIHGKGTGTLRETVHAVLGKLPEVLAYRLAGPEEGGWGATLVTLRPPVLNNPLNPMV